MYSILLKLLIWFRDLYKTIPYTRYHGSNAGYMVMKKKKTASFRKGRLGTIYNAFKVTTLARIISIDIIKQQPICLNITKHYAIIDEQSVVSQTAIAFHT